MADGSSARTWRTSTGLGWASLALAVPAVAPRAVARVVGVRPTPGTTMALRLVGLRELGAGAGILAATTSRARAAGLWARVAGDAVDLALLGAALRDRRSRRGRIAGATAAVAAIAAVDVLHAARLRGGAAASPPPDEPGGGPVVGRTATTVRRPPEEVYAAWRDLSSLPTFMTHLESVTELDATRSHWVATGPGGVKVEWDAEVVEDEPGRVIAWRSLPGADVANAGRVELRPAPADQGTELLVEVSYEVPGGKLGEVVAKLLGEEPRTQVQDDVRRFKQVVETGEVVRSDGTLHGLRSTEAMTQRPAQPVGGGAGA